MGHTNDTALVFSACEMHSIVTDATGECLHWLFCAAHMSLELCENPTCDLCPKIRYTHGDSTA